MLELVGRTAREEEEAQLVGRLERPKASAMFAPTESAERISCTPTVHWSSDGQSATHRPQVVGEGDGPLVRDQVSKVAHALVRAASATISPPNN